MSTAIIERIKKEIESIDSTITTTELGVLQTLATALPESTAFALPK